MATKYDTLHIALAHLLYGSFQVIDQIAEQYNSNSIWERYQKWVPLHIELSSELMEEIAYLFHGSIGILIAEAQASASADELFAVAIKYLELASPDNEKSLLWKYITFCKWIEKILRSAERIYTDFIVESNEILMAELPSVGIIRTLGSHIHDEIKIMDVELPEDARIDSTICALLLTSTWEMMIYKLAIDVTK